jgi:hypothetical protein
MAKRRNPKKEKAQRNREYARRFRKQSSSSRFSRKNTHQAARTNSQSESAAEEE